MLFNSFAFIFAFLPITLIVYFYLGSKKPIWAAIWLAIASIIFYGWWDYHYLPLLFLSIAFNYFSGWFIGHADRSARKMSLIFSVTINLLLLGYFKYADFFISSINEFSGSGFSPLNIVLPIGISFFTFTQIAFLVDTYQHKVKEYNFVHYVLFVTYFPHLIAGPVLHHKEMMPQFADIKNYRVSAENFAIGMSIFTIGLAKKVLLADNLAPMANPVFAQDAHPQFIEAWLGASAYTFQLYFDFSGYSDMAIGLSRLFGIKLPLNFNSPYKASNIGIFWQRWHMTLSRFLRDYLYIPLGGNRHGQLNRYRNLMVTMLLGGLWHGAGWTFVVWGGLHGFYLVINHAWQFSISRFNSKRTIMTLAFSRLITFVVVLIAWCFFRSPDLPTAVDVVGGLFGQNGISLPTGFKSLATWFDLIGINAVFNGIQWIDFDSLGPIVLITSILVAFCMPNTQEIFQYYDPCYEKIAPSKSMFNWCWHPLIKNSLAMAVIFAFCILSMNKISEFLYFQF